MTQTHPRVALVTGASSGIGQATAEALHAAGFQVYGASRQPTGEASNGAVQMINCDVTDDASVEAAVSRVLAETGRIDVLINNAGVGLLAGAEESSVAQAQALFDVNFFGAVRLTNAVLPGMRTRQTGRIINVSSVQGFIPAPFFALYAATKHALEGYSESLDHEVRSQGIRVSLVEPAYTRTAFDGHLMAPDRPLTFYDAARANMTAVVGRAIKQGDPAAVISDVIVEAATAQTTRRRHAAGKAARRLALLRKLVPSSAFDASLRKQMGLPPG